MDGFRSGRAGRVGVLLGGELPERQLSLRSGEMVLAALRACDVEAVAIHVDRDLDLAVRQAEIDVAFLAVHGRGADGPVQGLLETLGIPYTGSSCAAAALAADKLKTKELLRLHNLPTPAYYCSLPDHGNAVEQHHGFGFPCVVKPRCGVAGLGVTLVQNAAALEAAVETARRFEDDVIVERHVRGREVQVAILDGEVLGVAELDGGGAILDYAARLAARMHVITPPRIGHDRLRGVRAQALRAHHLLGCSGLTRVDVLVSHDGNESLLEVEALPDLGPASPVMRLAAEAGLDPAGLVGRILDGARLHAGSRRRRAWPMPARTREVGAAGAARSH